MTRERGQYYLTWYIYSGINNITVMEKITIEISKISHIFVLIAIAHLNLAMPEGKLLDSGKHPIVNDTILNSNYEKFNQEAIFGLSQSTDGFPPPIDNPPELTS